VECPFDEKQAVEMLSKIQAGNPDRVFDILAENTQYLSDINTIHFFSTLRNMLYAKLDGNFLGKDVEAALSNIISSHTVAKESLASRIQSASKRTAEQQKSAHTKAPSTPDHSSQSKEL